MPRLTRVRPIPGVCRPAAVLALLLALWPASRTVAFPLPSAVSDSLLAEARNAHYAGDERRAIPVFQAYLRAHPRDCGVRLDLANALAWSGDPERAVPLYRELLREEPNDPKLLRAQADCLRWAGRVEESLDLYRLLPEPPAEPEVRREIDRLRRSLDPAGGVDAGFYHDSGEIDAQRYLLGSRLMGGSAHSLAVSIGMERITQEAAVGALSTPWGRTVTLRASSALGPGRSMRFDAGWIDYDGGPRHGRVEAILRTPITRWTPTEIRVSYRDRALDLYSFGAYHERIRGLDASAATYASFGAAGGIFARARAGRLSDGNSYGASEASADARIAAGLRGAVAGSFVDYTEESTAYYAPRNEWSAAGHLIFDGSLPASVHLRLDGWLGRIGNLHGKGVSRGGRLRLQVPVVRSFDLRLEGEAGRSRNAATFTSRLLTLALDWRP
jgi:hypothetical protein